MRVSIVDRAELEGVEISDEGYLLAYARVARTGVYDYAGSELGRPDLPKVSVLRSADAVFDTASVATLLDKPVTNDHPSVNVVADNWAQLAVGNVRDEAMRDGEFLRVPLTIKSKSAVKAYQDGKKELSPGYRAEITFADGVAPDGTPYQAIMTDLRYNHLALVDKARGGSHCRIGDSFTDPTVEKTMKRFVLDGVSIDLADATAVETALAKLQTQVADGAKLVTDAQAEIAKLTTDAANKDAEIVTLKQAVTDAKMTPAQINDAVKALASVRDAAKKLAPALAITDAMDAADIRKAVVSARLGDKAKDWTDAQIEASFGTLTDAAPGKPVLDNALGNVTNIDDAVAARDKAIADRNARFETDYRTEAK